MPKLDVYQTVTDTIIRELEAGTAPWQSNWEGATGKLDMPRRANGQYYRGINTLVLWISAMSKGYTADQWMTFKQAKAAGGCVRKGEKGTQVVYFDTFTKEDDATGEERKIPFAKAYTVFNVQQIDGLPSELQADMFDDIDTGARADADMEAFYNAIGAQIVYTGGQPCYIPAQDRVQMPHVHQFTTADEYYGTLSHELVHWTGHTSRLDRLASNKKEAYAFEELVAELGACFVVAQKGGTYNAPNSASYIKSWLRALRDDKRMIFRAASAAQKAADFLFEAAETGEDAKAA
jgi:antirestriction protein ArdC